MALRNQPYIPLYVQDFLTDEKLIECSAQATGVYIRLMCIMHKSEPYGTILLKQKDKQNGKQTKNFALKLAKHLPYDLNIIEMSLDELIGEGVLILDGDQIIQKRMVKDNYISDERAKAGSKGGKVAQAKIKPKHKAKAKANTENETETVNEIVNVTKNVTKTEIISPFNSQIFKESWEKWKRFKKVQHNFTYKSQDSEEGALRKLDELSKHNEETAIKIIEQSIAQGWQGLFELKTESSQPQNLGPFQMIPQG